MPPTLNSTFAEQRFLFLQGVCSPFFSRLAIKLRACGHRVRKVNFTAGDRFYWNNGDAVSYRGPMAKLSDFYTRQIKEHQITDIVLFGDCRPVHRPAIQIARAHNVRVHVFEEGYFRPYWITLERNGVNANSGLSRDPDWYRTEARNVPHYNNGTAFPSPFWKRAAYDVGYNFWAGLNPVLHPGVRSHVPYSPLTEYMGYLRRGIRVKWQERTSRQVEAGLIGGSEKNPFYLLPLQLANDAQIVHHSPYKCMSEAMLQVAYSFAKFAPENSYLAVKIHPLDPGLINYKAKLRAAAKHLKIDGRIFYLESGNLPSLLSHTAGVITVNSTVGGSALVHGRPTIALGKAIYNMPGLTFQDGLDKFWTEKRRPDAALFRNFRDVVVDSSQINGGFYSKEGIALAIENCTPHLIFSSVDSSRENKHIK